MADYVSMPDYRARVEKRGQDKLADRSSAEAVLYLQQMSFVRESAEFSGIPEWTEAHTIGALFACSSLLAGIAMVRQAGLISKSTEAVLRQLIGEQEVISVMMERH